MAFNHSVELIESTSSNKEFYVLTTNISYVRPKIINKPLSDTSYIGINGATFRPNENGYFYPPEDGCGISWNKNGTDNHILNYSKKYVFEGNTPLNRGTIYIYQDDRGALKQRAGCMRTMTVDGILNRFPDMDIVAMIGGGSLSLDKTESQWEDIVHEEDFYATIGPIQNTTAFINFPIERTGLGYKYSNITGITTAYLVISNGNATLKELRNFFKDNLECDNAIHLDGSDCSGMQYKDANNNDAITYIPDRGNESERYIWNMIQVINVN